MTGGIGGGKINIMNEFTLGILTAIIPALFVSIITAIITVNLSMKQFYSQRWWEKKAEAYSTIIEHLSYLQIYFDAYLENAYNYKIIDKKHEEKLSSNYQQATETLKKSVAIGAYIISDEATITLKKLMVDLEKEDPDGNWVEDFDNYYDLVKKCIAKTKEIAKKDLSDK